MNKLFGELSQNQLTNNMKTHRVCVLIYMKHTCDKKKLEENMSTTNRTATFNKTTPPSPPAAGFLRETGGT